MLKEALRARTAGTAKEKQIFIFGHCRLTVLTPRLIRVEHCPDGAFEDRASTAVWFRAFDVPPCKATLHRGGALTDHMQEQFCCRQGLRPIH